jgi:hypothetical protein
MEKLMFYSIYGGWHLNLSTPILFNEPSQALAWGVSRMIRDGIMWNPTYPPEFLPFVGQVGVKCEDLVSASFSSFVNGKPSKIEQYYFQKVVFYELKNASSVQSEPKYLKCNENIVNSVLSTMNSKADYQLSAGSTYRKSEICPPSSSADVEIGYLRFLENFKRRDSPFIQLQHNCSHLKENAKFDRGTY